MTPDEEPEREDEESTALTPQAAPKPAMHPSAFSREAKNYAEATRRTFCDYPREPLRFGFAFYHLASHAIELALKAFLMLHGLSVEKLHHRFGHKLRKLLRKAKSCGLDARFGDVAKLQAYVDVLDEPHRERLFGYPEARWLTTPWPAHLLPVVEQLVSAVHEQCEARCLSDFHEGKVGLPTKFVVAGAGPIKPKHQ